jgi:DNA-binding Lrp family transcriptional regulator
VGRKVVADMFGMALRTYQKRVQRLGESASVRGRTLWQAVHDFLGEHGAVRRKLIEERFRHDSADDLGAVLNDLVASGLVYATGRGPNATYRALTASERDVAVDEESLAALSDMAWLAIYRARTLKLSELRTQLGASVETTARAVDRLVADAIVRRSGAPEDPELQAENFVVPVASSRGWEASVFDHFSTVATSIAAKVRLGAGSRHGESIGGATYNFDVYAGHPCEARVMSLLTRMRKELDALWEEASGYNRQHPVRDDRKTRVSFYFGQNVHESEAAVDAAAEPPSRNHDMETGA